MLQIQGLVKSFGRTDALLGVDLEVAKGEFLTIVGPNGAGKTTLLRILAMLLKPTSGRVFIDGRDIASGDTEIRRQIGFVSHQPLLYSHLTVEENLYFYGRLYDVRALHERVEMLLALVGLEGRRHSLAGTLSRGMQQRLSVARSIMHQPVLMLLDEPYSGLDAQAIQVLNGFFRRADASRTIIMTTHNLEQGLEMCDRVAILSNGRIVHEASKSDLTLAELQQAYWQYAADKSGRQVS